MLTIAASTPGPGWHLTATEVAVGAAVLAAAASLIGLWITHQTAQSRSRRDTLTDIWFSRLNELLSPILQLLDQDAVLIARLREDKPAGWHILDHVAEVLADETDRELALLIVKTNGRIVKVLDAKAGLLGDQPPASFADFRMHQQMLADALEDGRHSREPASVQRFPEQFETDVRAAYTNVLEKLRKELKDL